MLGEAVISSLAVYLRAGSICKRICAIAAVICLPSISTADPWVKVGDERTRHHLSYLNDSGAISLPLTTWPLNWANVSMALGNIQFDRLSDAQLWSYRYVKHALKRANRTLKTKKSLYASNSPQPFTHFSEAPREEVLAQSDNTLLKGWAAVNLSASAVRNASDGDKYRFDGTYIAATTGNWVIGIGAIDRWWGPGWQSSIILSNNARPAPGIFIKRKTSAPAQLPLLHWAGPWQLELFANQLEDEREIDNTALIGARLSIHPLSFIALSQSYLNLRGGEHTDPAFETNKASQQHISYDARLHGNAGHLTWALYGQLLHNTPRASERAQNASLLGIESSFVLNDVHNRVVLEVSDTSHDLTSQDEANTTAIYEHPYYREGYRHYGRSLGEAADTNATKTSLAGTHYFANGQQLAWRASEIKINEAAPSGNAFSDAPLSRKFYEVSYTVPLNDVTQISGGVFYLNEKLHFGTQEINTGGFATLELRF